MSIDAGSQGDPYCNESDGVLSDVPLMVYDFRKCPSLASGERPLWPIHSCLCFEAVIANSRHTICRLHSV